MANALFFWLRKNFCILRERERGGEREREREKERGRERGETK
jgi:hypothetical protein